MNEYLIKEIVDRIYSDIGLIINGCSDPTEDRDGLVFWFESYTRGNGPIFSIRPIGLKRHAVTLKFGPYAEPCIRHINVNANNESVQLFKAFIKQLSKSFDLSESGLIFSPDLKIENNFKIEVVRKVEDQRSTDNLISSVLNIMPLLMGGIAELIGCKVTGMQEDLHPEGQEKISIYRYRERNSRNRMLCLSIHGKKCKVCGFTDGSKYIELSKSIIEVHHIEPLSELEQAKEYDPETDLIPLCPNCHRVIHTTKPAMKPSDLARILR